MIINNDFVANKWVLLLPSVNLLWTCESGWQIKSHYYSFPQHKCLKISSKSYKQRCLIDNQYLVRAYPNNTVSLKTHRLRGQSSNTLVLMLDFNVYTCLIKRHKDLCAYWRQKKKSFPSKTRHWSRNQVESLGHTVYQRHNSSDVSREDGHRNLPLFRLFVSFPSTMLGTTSW